MKKIIIGLSKMILSLVQIPLWFIKLFHDVGHLPNADTGEIDEVHFYHSMFENISDLDCSFFLYISIGLVVLSVSLTIVSIIKNNKKINLSSNMILIISIVSFIIFLIMASTVARGY